MSRFSLFALVLAFRKSLVGNLHGVAQITHSGSGVVREWVLLSAHSPFVLHLVIVSQLLIRAYVPQTIITDSYLPLSALVITVYSLEFFQDNTGGSDAQ